MSELLTVHDPRGYPPKVAGKRLAPRPQSLDGKVVYLVDCLFDNSARSSWTSCSSGSPSTCPAVVTRIIRPRESWEDDPDMRARIVADGDAAILRRRALKHL